MPNISDYVLSERLRLLVYGKSKSGKTWGAGTFPRPNFIDMDKGVSTVISPAWLAAHANKSDIMYEQFPERGTTTRGVYSQVNGFDDACKYFDACMNPKGAKWTSTSNGKVYDVHPDMFDTWVLDSGTTLAEAATRKGIIILGQGTKPLSMTHKNALASGLITLRQQDFGAERSMTEQFIDMLLQANKHVVVIAHERENYSESGNLERVVPLFTGQSTERIPLKFDEVYNLRAQKEGVNLSRKLQTVDDGIRLAGTRGLGMPDKTAWNFAAIVAALKSRPTTSTQESK